jgi:ankyrin repeat protein
MVDLLLKNGAKQDVDYEGDQTPLMLAARSGRADMLKLLLDNDASTINLVHLHKFDGFLNPQRVDFTHSALTYAVKSKKIDAVTLLLDRGARTDLPTTKSPLQLAQELGLTDIADLLTARQSVNKAPATKPPSP